MERPLSTKDHHAYREMVRELVARQVEPNLRRWDEARLIDRPVRLAAGKQGIVGLGVPEEFAKAGAASLATSFSLQDNVAIPCVNDLGTEEQKSRWLPGMASGELIGAASANQPPYATKLHNNFLRRTTCLDRWPA